jgi:hypothetical protein
MNLELKNARINWRDGKDFSQPGMSFGFTAVPIGRDHVNLKNNEILVSPAYARIFGKDKEIVEVVLSLGEETFEESGREWRSEMVYLNSTVFFAIRLPVNQLAELQNLILRGNVPRSVHILFDDKNLEHGGPDGSNMVWDNETFKSIGIQSAMFGDFTIPGYASTFSPGTLIGQADTPDTNTKEMAIVRELSFIKGALIVLVIMVGFILWNHH